MEPARRIAWFLAFGGLALVVFAFGTCGWSCAQIAGGAASDMGAADTAWAAGALMFWLGAAMFGAGVVLQLLYRAISGR